MTNEELKAQVTQLLPSATFEEGGEWLTVLIEPQSWKFFAKQLRTTKGLDLDYLFCVTCVDWKTHLSMVYHLSLQVME